MIEIAVEGWTYYTRVNPMRCLAQEINNNDEEYKKKYNEAFNSYLDYLKFKPAKVKCWINNNPNRKFKVSIYIDEIRDIVNSNSKYSVIFKKSQFLRDSLFVKTLQEFYNENGIHVNGPISNNYHWNFTFYFLKTYRKSASRMIIPIDEFKTLTKFPTIA